jgi:hypothetical protein
MSYFTVNSMSLVGTTFEWQREVGAGAPAAPAVDPKDLGGWGMGGVGGRAGRGGSRAARGMQAGSWMGDLAGWLAGWLSSLHFEPYVWSGS